MELAKLSTVISGVITHSGSATQVNSATVYVEKVDKGDVCFVQNQKDADLAIQNGAMALVYRDDTISIENQSITLIKVEDLQKAAFTLIGALFGEEDVSFELISEKQMSFLKMILTRKNSIAFIPDDWQKAFEFILNSNKRVFIGTNEAILKTIRPKISMYNQKASGQIISSDSLFRTTFKVNKYIYQYKQMTPFHITCVRQVADLCDKYALEYSLDKIAFTKHFRPIFLEGEPTIQEVMKNDKVVILSDNLEDIIEGKNYAGNVGQWMAKSIVLVPPKTKVEGTKTPVYYRSEEDILDAIESLSYNYLFVYTDDQNLSYLIQKKLEL